MNKISFMTIASMFFLSVSLASASTWINLEGTGQVKVNDSSSLDGFSRATWNMWIKESNYTDNAGTIGKYVATGGQRSYLIRTSLTNSTSVIISADGTNLGSYASSASRACGIRNKNEWTMVTVTYNGSSIKYYRDGVLCDTDQTTIASIRNSPTAVSLGGGNNVYFQGGIDEFRIYNETLTTEQVQRLYNESQYGSGKGQSIPVLVYHRIENSTINDTIMVSTANFQKQMKYLHDNGFTPITVEQYYEWRNGGDIPEKSVIIFFDDGWKTAYTNAKPIMDQYGFVGTVAAVMDYSYGSSGGPSYMHWDELQNLSNSGWSIESHGKEHAHMLTLTEDQFRLQLSDSKSNITTKIGDQPHAFIFPFHESNSTWTHICSEYYDLCWTQGSPNPTYDFKDTDASTYESLRRINIINDTTMKDYADLLGKDVNNEAVWEMEEGTGNYTHDSMHNNTGNLTKGATWSNSAMRMMSASSSSSPFTRVLSGLFIPAINVPGVIDHIVDSDIGKADLPLIDEKRWPENMEVEKDIYYPPVKLDNAIVNNVSIQTEVELNESVKTNVSKKRLEKDIKQVKSTTKNTISKTVKSVKDLL